MDLQQCFLFMMFAVSLLKQSNGIWADHRLLSEVNLEHYYVIEENVMSHADALLKEDHFDPDDEESKEEHMAHAPNLTEFISVIDETKEIHRKAGLDLTTFLTHPINVYHLLRRLNTTWRKSIDIVLKAKPCKKWNLSNMVSYLNYLKESLPKQPHLDLVVSYMALLQNIYGSHPRDIAQGKMVDLTSLYPLSFQEQVEIAKSLRDQDDTRTALGWLELIADSMQRINQSEWGALGITKIGVLNMIATSQYLENNFKAALNTTARILELDPSNEVARHNEQFYKRKMTSTTLTESDVNTRDKKHRRKRLRSKFVRLCAGKGLKSSTLKCTLEPIGSKVSWLFRKTEVLRRKPYIMMYHDVIDTRTADLIRNHSYEKLAHGAWTANNKFRGAPIRMILSYYDTDGWSTQMAIRRLATRVRRLPLPPTSSFGSWGNFQVLNAEANGMHFNLYADHLDLNPWATERDLGNYVTFLSEPKHGGQVVMRSRNIVAYPRKGSVLFYYAKQTKHFSVCPSLGGSMWVAVEPFYEKFPDVCYEMA